MPGPRRVMCRGCPNKTTSASGWCLNCQRQQQRHDKGVDLFGERAAEVRERPVFTAPPPSMRPAAPKSKPLPKHLIDDNGIKCVITGYDTSTKRFKVRDASGHGSERWIERPQQGIFFN